MMKEDSLKLKKGGLDTIVAYIVVMLPLLYVVVYMVATIYHFSVQSYVSQVVKEAITMASTYGTVTSAQENYIHSKLKNVLGTNETDDSKADCTIEYFIRRFNEDDGTMDELQRVEVTFDEFSRSIEKADIIGIQVKSNKESILGSVTSFDIFGSGSEDPYVASTDKLIYSAYREEIIRNENPRAVEAD